MFDIKFIICPNFCSNAFDLCLIPDYKFVSILVPKHLAYG